MRFVTQSPDDVNYLRRLLASGAITDQDLSAGTMSGSMGPATLTPPVQNALAQMLSEQQQFASLPPDEQMDADLPMNSMRNEDTGNVTYFGRRGASPAPYGADGMAAPMQPKARMKVAGYGNDGIMSDLGETMQDAPALDYSRGAVDTPKGRGYYGKDGAVYIPGQGGTMTKVMLGYDRDASYLAAKRDFERRKGEADLQQAGANLEHTREQTRASQVNNPDFGAAGAAASGLTGDALLQSLDPATAGQVKALAEGRMSFPGGAAMRSPRVMNLLGLVSQYDPTFDATDFNVRNKTLAGFTQGKQGDAVRAVNQAIAHAGSLSESIDKLDNFNGLATPLNWPVNTVEQAFGDTRQGAFKQNAVALASELRKVFAGSGGGSLEELRQWEAGLPLNASKEQQHAYLQKGLELLNGAIGALSDQYKRGMGPRANVMDIVSPKAKSTLDNLLSGGSPSAELKSPPDPRQYAGKRMQSPDGTIYKSDGSRWVRQ